MDTPLIPSRASPAPEDSEDASYNPGVLPAGKLSPVEAVAFLSLVTCDPTSYKETIEFYSYLGFSVVRQHDREISGESSDPSLARDARRESWLHSTNIFGDGNSRGATIKVRLVATAPSKAHVMNRAENLKSTVHDWRGLSSSVVFSTNDLIGLLQKLKDGKKNYVYKPVPDVDLCTEVYVLDPSGTLVGFTSDRNPFSKQIPVDTTASHSSGIVAGFTEKDVDEDTPTGKQSAPRKKIGIMTSGGDAQGMNAVVRAVVRAGIYKGCEVFAIYEGYDGLVNGGDMIKQMHWEDVRGWLSEGGTLIGTARCAAFRERWGRLAAAKNMIVNGIDGIIICGGDGSLTGADLFRAEWPDLVAELVSKGELTKEQTVGHEHLMIAGLVGSIDNDLSSTDATIGAYSSLDRICQMIDYIDTTAESHSRAFVVEVMGRHCGWLGVMSGVATGADYIFIPEHPPKHETWGDDMIDVVNRHRRHGKRKTLVIVSEGAIDDKLYPISSEKVKDLLVDRLGLDTRITTLGHVQRGGTACAFDRMLATLQGFEAVDAILDSTADTPSPVIAINENKISRKPLVEAVKLTHQVADAIEAGNFDKAMDLRDTEFKEYYDAFLSTILLHDHTRRVPQEKRLRIAIIHIGAPAGGMNAATRSAALYCLSRGHTPYAILNGFTGLTRHEAVRALDWLGTDTWATRGGSEIGTNRNTPDVDMGMVAWYFEKYHFDGLIIVGGFEAYTSLYQLQQARKAYPAFRIPMVCLPATISNNVPGTEYSIGSDTCLNELVEYCDIIKQSASATRRRVFVVEVQGGNSGYVASYAGLVCGAISVYTPEEGINLHMLEVDVRNLKESFAHDQGQTRQGKLMIVNEKASKTYTTEIIANIVREEGGNRFQARTAIPGHVQQGGIPSPMDRLRSVRLGIKCCQFIEENQGTHQEVLARPETAAVIGIVGAKIVFTDVQKLQAHDTEHILRRPKRMHWETIIKVSDILSGVPPKEL